MNLLHANDRPGQYPASYYAATATPLSAFPALLGATKADICIVGGGYTGLSAALHLAERGLNVVLLEAHKMGFGASGRNGGQVGSGQRQDQDWLEQAVGHQQARRLWDLAEEAKALVKTLAKSMSVPFHPGVAAACYTARDTHATHVMAEKLNRSYGYTQIESLDQDAMRRLIGSNVFAGGAIDRGAGYLNPLNYALGLAAAAARAGARLHEASEVTQIDHGPKPVVHTANGSVTCDQVILAANGYLGRLQPRVAARVMPINNFIIATEPLDRPQDILSEPVAVADTKFVVNYWRLSEDNRLLFGGGESYGYRFPADIAKTVSKSMLAIYPQLKGTRITHAWGGTLAITLNRMPCFIRPQPNVLSASGYSGHGVAMATLAGKILAEAAATQTERFDLMANLPQATFPGGAALRWPLLVLAMTWYGMRDRLGL